MQDSMLDTERIIVSLSGRTRVPFKPPFNVAAKVTRIEYHQVTDVSAGDKYMAVGLSKYPYDNCEAPSSPLDVISQQDVFAKLTWYRVNTSGSGFTSAVCDLSSKPLFFVIDPTFLSYSNVSYIAELYFQYVKLPPNEFNRVAMWQGGFSNRTAL